jgi:SAM-dependent methyltransferase
MPAAAAIRRFLARRRPPALGGTRVQQTQLGWVRPWGIIDWADIDGGGVVRVFGWSHQPSEALVAPAVTIGETELGLNKIYRMLRPDVPQGPPELGELAGFVFEYLVAAELFGVPGLNVQFAVDGEAPKLVRAPRPFIPPAFHHLLTQRQVLGRDQIYGFGPPARHVHGEVLTLAKATPGTVLDFGCGAGALVAALRGLGREAHGIELDRPPIREAMLPAAMPHVRLYDGGFPMPFPDKHFDTVVCSEVLEHITDYRAALADIARVCRRRVLLTVPDMAAIPIGSQHGLIPWHLLESTHYNFFTQESLALCLEPHFPRVTFARMSMARVQDSIYFINLVAVCDLPG